MQLVKKTIKKDSYAVKITIEEDKKIMGWAFIFIKYADRHIEPYAYLENVYVEEEYQKRGIGTKLVKLAIEEAQERGCYKIIGTSKHQKTAVHNWYEKHGFKRYGYAFRMDLIKDSKTLTSDGREGWTELK